MNLESPKTRALVRWMLAAVLAVTQSGCIHVVSYVTFRTSRPVENLSPVALGVAAAALPALRQVESDLEKAVPRLARRGTALDYRQVVDKAETGLEAAFAEDAPTALRYAIDSELARAREAIPRSAWRPQPLASSFRTASWAAGGRAAAADRRRLSAFAKRLLDFVASLRRHTEAGDLLVNLCVRSTPSEASFRLYPKSSEDEEWRTTTDVVMVGVWRGLYHYKIEHEGRQPIVCAPQSGAPANCSIDLLQLERPLLECELKRRAKTSVFCRLREARDGDCPDVH